MNKIVSVFACIFLFLCVTRNSVSAFRLHHHEREPQILDTVDKLQLVHVFFRHGDRTPIDEYPKDPYNDLFYWPEGWGQLTKIGKRMQYNLGKYLRSQYDGFLSQVYSSAEVYARSSDSDRTIMSVLANLAGLFPPTNQDLKSLWSDDIKWQPIPVRAIPATIDNKIAFKQSCPRYELLLSEFLKGAYMQNFDRENAQLYRYLSEHTGLNVTNYNPVSDIYDTLKIQKLYNLTLPEWTHSVFPDKMYPSALIWLKKYTFTDELKKLRAGPIFSEIVGTMDRAMGVQAQAPNNSTVLPPAAKLYLYGSHDNTLSAILEALGLFKPHIPTYASSLYVELHRKDSTGRPSYFVKVLYRTNLTNNFSDELEIPDCGKPCSVDQFKKIIKPYLHYGQRWEQLCLL